MVNTLTSPDNYHKPCIQQPAKSALGNTYNSQAEAIECMKQYIPDSTVNYIHKRSKQRKESFFTFMGEKLYKQELERLEVEKVQQRQKLEDKEGK